MSRYENLCEWQKAGRHSVEELLEAAKVAVAELEDEARRRRDDSANEVVRVGRWHATYNAALTGLYSCGVLDQRAHREAAEAANHAHGELKCKP